jgi:predicted secreted acid phosphatase
VVVFDIDETVLSNMDQILDPVTWPWDKWVAAAQAPALQPTLQYYRALCDAGYSVAFVTGRKESSRQATMHNLEVEGYGKPCAEGPGPFYGPRPLQTDSSSNGSGHGCCYSALYLRQAGDTSLASVYKPGARKDLLQKGNMTLIALVGDQFSDLNGEVSAPYAFKLPNPFYYIL